MVKQAKGWSPDFDLKTFIQDVDGRAHIVGGSSKDIHVLVDGVYYDSVDAFTLERFGAHIGMADQKSWPKFREEIRAVRVQVKSFAEIGKGVELIIGNEVHHFCRVEKFEQM